MMSIISKYLKSINICLYFIFILFAAIFSYEHSFNRVYFPYKLDLQIKSQENNSLELFFSSTNQFDDKDTTYIDISKSNDFLTYSTIFHYQNTKFIKIITRSNLQTQNIVLSNRFVSYNFNNLDSLIKDLPQNYFSKITQILLFLFYLTFFFIIEIAISYPVSRIFPLLYKKWRILYKKINSYDKKHLSLIILFVGLSLSSFINIKKDPGWNGDDYAQYLHQSKNIVENKPQNMTGLKYTQYTIDWGAPAYVPVGFPLILSPVYLLGGYKIIHFNIYISLLLFITGILLYLYYFKIFNNRILSLILVFIFTFNPYVVNFKGYILSEIPFILFLLLILFLYQKETKYKFSNILLISFLIGFIVTIRPAGAVLILSTFLYPLYYLIFKKKTNLNKLKLLLIPILSILFYLIITKLIFKTPQDTYFQKSILVQKIFSPNIYLKVLSNLLYTLREVLPHYKYLFINTLIYKTALVSIFCGYLLKLFKKIELSEIFIIVYILMLLYLNTGRGQGFRYLLPLFPFFIEYIYIFLDNIFLKPKNKLVLFSFILTIIILQYIKFNKININNNIASLSEGVESSLATETFNYINKNIPSDTLIIGREARTIALFTNNFTHPIIPFFSDQTTEDMENKYREIGTKYFLYDKQSPNPKEWWLEIFVKNSKNVKLIWNNERFYLYENVINL